MNQNHSLLPYMNYKQLQEFRQEAYELLNFAKDATFELMDAILTTRHAYSLADFSLSPFFRRKWSSTYEALEDCRPSRNKLMGLYKYHLPWQKPIQNLTPGRVAQSMTVLLPEIGTPAVAPKPRGKSRLLD